MILSKKTIGFVLSIVAFISIIFFLNLNNNKISFTLAIAVLMAIWWIMEVVPLAITSLLPVVLFPLFGIIDGKEISSAYFNDIIFLFLGGFYISLAMQKSHLDKRIALKILSILGVKPGNIVLGFIIATAFLSMWISNTATAMMMLPVALSVLDKLKDNLTQKQLNKLSVSILLSIAYSASIGGIATLIGTPPNLAFIKIFSITFPKAPEISFSQWMLFGMPLSISMLTVLWLLFYFFFFRKIKIKGNLSKNIFKNQYKNLGKISRDQIFILIAFISFIILLLFRKDINIGNFKIPGWSNLFNNPKYLNDGTIAIAIAILLFLIPSTKKSGKLLDCKTAKNIPWNIILLFGGGFALAKAFVSSGLSLWIGNKLGNFLFDSQFLNMILFVSVMIFLTELTSNTATTQIFLPVIAGIAITSGENPLFLMIPVTIAASMAFMLPVATPPNAIIFGSNKIKISQMSRFGILLNLIAIVIITIFVYIIAINVFNIDINNIPSWIK